MTNTNLPWKPMEDDDLPDEIRTVITCIIPRFRQAAIDQRDGAAYVMLEASEQLMRLGNKNVGSMLGALATASLFDRDMLKQIMDAASAISEARSEDIEHEHRVRFSGTDWENLTHAQRLDLIRQRARDSQ